MISFAVRIINKCICLIFNIYKGMKVFSEKSLTNFEFWSGAKCRAEQLTYEELEQLEYILEDIYPDGMDEVLINDLFWFDFPIICEWLGLTLDDNEDIIRDEE